jgi:hypothetical protein
MTAPVVSATVIWLLFLAEVAVFLILGLGMHIGARMRDRETADERVRLAERERQLQVEWDALEQTQRINEAFWQARTALRDEALRHRRSTNIFNQRTS